MTLIADILKAMEKQTIAIIISFIVLAIFLMVGMLESKKPGEVFNTKPNIIPEKEKTTPEDSIALQEEAIEKIAHLTPREVVQRFLEADMAGARLGGEVAKKAPDIGGYSLFPWGGDLAMVIDKYEIVDEYPSENEGYYFVKVKYFCKRGIAAGSFGPWRIKTEGPFVSIPCDSFLKYLEEPAKTSHLYEIKCPQCPEEFEEPAKTLEGFDTENEIHRVTFELIKDNGEWKIDLPIVSPHISEETLKKHLESFKETK